MRKLAVGDPHAVHLNVNFKKLGILVRFPVPGGIETRLVPPLDAEEARDLYAACLADLFARVSKLKKVSTTVFFAGEDPGAARDSIPRPYSLVRQSGNRRSDRCDEAFRVLLGGDGDLACLIGSESPDLPLVYLKRAFVKLKHRDVVLGPTFGGGCYLIGLKRQVPGLLEDLPWEEVSLLPEILRRVRSAGLACALLPPWYEVNTPESLSFLDAMLLARGIEKRDRLHSVERVLETIRRRSQ